MNVQMYPIHCDHYVYTTSNCINVYSTLLHITTALQLIGHTLCSENNTYPTGQHGMQDTGMVWLKHVLLGQRPLII